MICYRCGAPVEGTRFTPSNEQEGASYHQDWTDCIKGLRVRVDALEMAVGIDTDVSKESLEDFPWRLVKDDFPKETFDCGCTRHRLGRCECGAMAYLVRSDGAPL